MSRLQGALGAILKTQLLPVNQDGFWNAPDISDKIYDSIRSYRNDRCAIFIDSDSTYDFLRDTGLQADVLKPDENWHWTGTQRRKKLKRIIVADYEEWFRWFMKWQRFNTFQVFVLITPVRLLRDYDKRGYLDGFLTRLLNNPKVNRIIIVEEERVQPIIKRWLGLDGQLADVSELEGKFKRSQFREAIASLLYGTNLSTSGLLMAARSTLFSKVNPTWEAEFQDIKRRPALVERLCRSKYIAGYHAREMVESLETEEARKTLENPEQPLPHLFKQARRKGPSELGQEYLEELTQILLDSQGWFTLASLYEYVNAKTQNTLRTSTSFPRIFNEHYDHERPSQMHVFVPSRPILRNIAQKLAKEGKVQKTTWVKEIGRPATVYFLPGQLPFDAENRCGQCALYVPLRRHCRIWWLLNKSYGYRHYRWERDGAQPLSGFEIHKMRNSWRIGPHSSACSRFVDKKRDYRRTALPELCDICHEQLPASPPKGGTVICTNCRTRYFKLRQSKVRVLTSYEHEFKSRYQELAGVEPASDLKRLFEESQSSAASIVEQAIYDQHRHSDDDDPDSAVKTVMLFPGDRMLAKDGRLFVFKKRSVESLPLEGSTLVDQGGIVSEEQRGILESSGMTIKSVSKSTEHNEQGSQVRRYDIAPAVEKVVIGYPEFLRKMSLAMAQSSMHATEHIGSLAHLGQGDMEIFIRKQKMLTHRLEHVPAGRFLVYEAMIMKEYWTCYHLALDTKLQRSGPRKKARFVREFVTNPAGRARGYTAMDAAINYVHQRRLFKARSVNFELGLDYNPGEGFLHRKRWHPDGLGLILDLIDPFKFADREKLLEAILDVSVNWRDFYNSTDRHGARFYYPKPETIGVLESVSDEADKMIVSYDGTQVKLEEAYRKTVSALIQNLQADTPQLFTPFVYGTREDVEWLANKGIEREQ